MKLKSLFLFLLIAVFSFSSCKDRKRQQEITKLVSEWMGKEILFPENISCYVSGKDTLPGICSELFQKEYKVLMYVDSAGCSSCRLKLFEWKQLIEEADSISYGRVGFLLYFQPKSAREMSYLFLQNQFDYPVFMDLTGSINRLNRFPQAMEYQCFLLDKNNRVVMIGNPVQNPRIWELYKEQIGGDKQAEQVTNTTITIDKTAYDYGVIQKGNVNKAAFTITNTGDYPFVIYHVSTSCGCTGVEWEKCPIEPGKTTTISVEMTPDETGYFSKTIDVYGNIKESPLRLTINGNVE